jgi:hypothetical protein
VETPEQAAPAKTESQSVVVAFLERYLEMARKGELQAVVLGFVKVDGGAAVQSTPMSAILMNHLCRLHERRVTREYDRAIAAAAPARQTTGAGAVPDKARQEAQLPRKARRQLEERARNLQKLAKKKAIKKKAAEELVRRPVTDLTEQ